jgi:hypothetical protein
VAGHLTFVYVVTLGRKNPQSVSHFTNVDFEQLSGSVIFLYANKCLSVVCHLIEAHCCVCELNITDRR